MRRAWRLARWTPMAPESGVCVERVVKEWRVYVAEVMPMLSPWRAGILRHLQRDGGEGEELGVREWFVTVRVPRVAGAASSCVRVCG